jgi:hypothetical protein
MTSWFSKAKDGQMIGYSDTIWYGRDHFGPCHHVEGMHAVVRYRPAISKDYAGDWRSIELRDELPPEPQHEAAKSAPLAPTKQD